MRARILILILIAASLVRIALLAAAWNAPGRLETPDSRGYVELSESLAKDAVFNRDGEPENFRTPGYPLFLTAGRPFGNSWWRAVAILQFLPALHVTILLLVGHFRTSKWWPLLCAAALAGLACYVRPVGLMFCVLATIVLLFGKKRFARAGAFAGIVLLIVIPWVVRNHRVAKYTGFSSFTADSMFYYSAPAVLSEVEGITLEQGRNRMTEEFKRKFDTCACFMETYYHTRDRRALALEVITAHPVTYSLLHLRGSRAAWLPGITDVLEIAGVTTGQRGTLFVLHERGLIAAVEHYLAGKMWALWLCVPAILILAAKYALVLICAAKQVRWRMGRTDWLILATILAFALVGGPAATPRFRVAVEPLLSLSAGAGIVLLADWIKRRKANALSM